MRAARSALPLALVGLCSLPALIALIALSAVVRAPRPLDDEGSEAAARRLLVLRAAELDSWLRQELLAPVDRTAFAEPGGAPEAAQPWREVVRSLEEAASRGAGSHRLLPPIELGSEPGSSIRAAIGARRFTPFLSMDGLVEVEWLRGARLFASLLEQSPAANEAPLAANGPPITPWLDAALVLASDLRSTGLLAAALGAAELEEVVERRLARTGDDGDLAALRQIAAHAEAAIASLPTPERIAERESRLAQAWVCAHARVAPFSALLDEDDPEGPWPVVAAAASVQRLESYGYRLRELLAAAPSDRVRASYEAWAAAFARDLPAAAPLVADEALLAPLRDTRSRLARIRAAAVDRLRRRQ